MRACIILHILAHVAHDILSKAMHAHGMHMVACIGCNVVQCMHGDIHRVVHASHSITFIPTVHSMHHAHIKHPFSSFHVHLLHSTLILCLHAGTAQRVVQRWGTWREPARVLGVLLFWEGELQAREQHCGGPSANPMQWCSSWYWDSLDHKQV